MAKRKYFIMKETGGKLRVDFRSWAMVILVGVLLTILSLIDRGGSTEPASTAPGATCSFTVNGSDVNVRAGSTTSAPAVGQLSQGQTVTATKTVTNGYRQLADGTWVVDDLLTPVPGSVCT